MWEALPSSSSNPYRITVFSIRSIMPSMSCLYFECAKNKSPIYNIVFIKALMPAFIHLHHTPIPSYRFSLHLIRYDLILYYLSQYY